MDDVTSLKISPKHLLATPAHPSPKRIKFTLDVFMGGKDSILNGSKRGNSVKGIFLYRRKICRRNKETSRGKLSYPRSPDDAQAPRKEKS